MGKDSKLVLLALWRHLTLSLSPLPRISLLYRVHVMVSPWWRTVCTRHIPSVQRGMVRAVLARTSFVLWYGDAPPEAGGWGATVVTLRRLLTTSAHRWSSGGPADERHDSRAPILCRCSSETITVIWLA